MKRKNSRGEAPGKKQQQSRSSSASFLAALEEQRENERRRRSSALIGTAQIESCMSPATMVTMEDTIISASAPLSSADSSSHFVFPKSAHVSSASTTPSYDSSKFVFDRAQNRIFRIPKPFTRVPERFQRMMTRVHGESSRAYAAAGGDAFVGRLNIDGISAASITSRLRSRESGLSTLPYHFKRDACMRATMGGSLVHTALGGLFPPDCDSWNLAAGGCLFNQQVDGSVRILCASSNGGICSLYPSIAEEEKTSTFSSSFLSWKAVMISPPSFLTATLPTSISACAAATARIATTHLGSAASGAGPSGGGLCGGLRIIQLTDHAGVCVEAGCSVIAAVRNPTSGVSSSASALSISASSQNAWCSRWLSPHLILSGWSSGHLLTTTLAEAGASHHHHPSVSNSAHGSAGGGDILAISDAFTGGCLSGSEDEMASSSATCAFVGFRNGDVSLYDCRSPRVERRSPYFKEQVCSVVKLCTIGNSNCFLAASSGPLCAVFDARWDRTPLCVQEDYDGNAPSLRGGHGIVVGRSDGKGTAPITASALCADGCLRTWTDLTSGGKAKPIAVVPAQHTAFAASTFPSILASFDATKMLAAFKRERTQSTSMDAASCTERFVAGCHRRALLLSHNLAILHRRRDSGPETPSPLCAPLISYSL